MPACASSMAAVGITKPRPFILARGSGYDMLPNCYDASKTLGEREDHPTNYLRRLERNLWIQTLISSMLNL